MIYLPLPHLRPGMIVARPVIYGSSFLPLLGHGQALSEVALKRLAEFQIPGVYIESTLGEDIEIKELVDPAIKQQMLCEIKSLYKGYVSNAPLSSKSLRSMQNAVDALLSSILSSSPCMLNIIDVKDYDAYTYSHSIYVASLSTLLGIQLGLARPALFDLAMAGTLHDIGKLDIPITIVNKPGPLDEEEHLMMKTHPFKAVRRLQAGYSVPTAVLRGIESHHERFDGTGYPRGAAGEKIPLYGRILALSDVYDALTSSRIYRRAWSPNETLEYMMGNAGTHFDAELLRAFLRTVAPFPEGMMVLLSDQSVALVVKNDPETPLRPRVRFVAPQELYGQEVNLATNQEYRSITIVGEPSPTDILPQNLANC